MTFDLCPVTLGRRALFAALGAVLLGAIGLVIYGETRPLERTFYGSVKDLLPKPEEVPGWTVQYLPIADTPEMQAKVSEILNYDDAVYAVYTKGSERVSIYIAYWTPGKMSQRLIAAHTPDVCWVKSGWETIASEQRDISNSGDPSTHVAEWRMMALDGHLEQLLFWHLVGAKPKSNRTNWRPSWDAALIDMALFGFRQREEQFFVRISGNRFGKETGSTQLLGTFAARIPPLRK